MWFFSPQDIFIAPEGFNELLLGTLTAHPESGVVSPHFPPKRKLSDVTKRKTKEAESSNFCKYWHISKHVLQPKNDVEHREYAIMPLRKMPQRSHGEWGLDLRLGASGFKFSLCQRVAALPYHPARRKPPLESSHDEPGTAGALSFHLIGRSRENRVCVCLGTWSDLCSAILWISKCQLSMPKDRLCNSASQMVPKTIREQGFRTGF